jgi:hypothetical protein
MRLHSPATLLLLGLGLAACGTPTRARLDGGGDSDGGTTMTGPMVVSPGTAMLTVKGGPATFQFTATYKGTDVTSSSIWAIDPMIGTISNGLLTVNYPLTHGGSVPITANYDGSIGAASVIINYFAPDIVDVSAPANAPSAFGGPASTDPNETPRIVYPFSNSMLARNINQMAIQWTRSQKDKVFKIHIAGQTIDVTFYVGASVCSGGGADCVFKPADKDWQLVTLSSSGQSATLTISGTASSGFDVATSRPITLNFSPDDVKGGFYYFSPSIFGLKRLPFGASTATQYIANGGNTGCVGCHAVSRDGKKVAATFWHADGTGGMTDGANGQNFLITPEQLNNATKRWNFATFNQDGSLLLTNWNGQLTLRDGTSGDKMMDVPSSLVGGSGLAVMPEWSPDGNSIVFVQLPTEGQLGRTLSQNGGLNLIAGDWIVGNAGAIAVMPYNNGSFGAANVIVDSMPMKEYNIYPSWSPDNQWIVFATIQYPGSSPTALSNIGRIGNPPPDVLSYDQDTARIRLVSAGGGAALELIAATHEANRTSTWPKFAPFLQNSGNLVFFTFSSKFAYGSIVRPQTVPQLWMSAIDLSVAKSELGSVDPSYPPFWLPFQDPNERNHSGVWTTDVACATSGDCPAEFTCQTGVCVPDKIM